MLLSNPKTPAQQKEYVIECFKYFRVVCEADPASIKEFFKYLFENDRLLDLKDQELTQIERSVYDEIINNKGGS
jgi:hypothetical protein